MAYDRSLKLSVDKVSSREKSLRETDGSFKEGGALNADYRTVEAIGIVCNALGINNMFYGRDFVFNKREGLGEISFGFCDEETELRAKMILSRCLPALAIVT